MKNLKKLASLLLALVMIFTFTFTGISVFAEETEPTITITPNTMAIDEFQAVTITVTGGTGGLEANKSYNIRLTKTSKTVDDSGFGKSGPYNYTFADGSTYPTTTVTTDANGGFTKEVNIHSSKITETGVYAYCIMDGWSTKAVANFEVTLGKAKLILTPEAVEIGSDTPISVTVTGGTDGLAANTWYRTRLYKVNTPKASGIGIVPSFNNSYKFSNDLSYVEISGTTTDSNGGFTRDFTAHSTYVTEVGYYVYTLMDSSWNTVASIGFEVTPVGAKLNMSTTSVELGTQMPITITVTSGANGLEANKSYNVRLMKSYKAGGTGGIGILDGINQNYTFSNGYNNVGAGTVTTDENGAFTKELIVHKESVTETGYYTYAIQDGWTTVATANFEVVELADHGHFTNTNTEFYIGKGNVTLTYENLDLVTFGTPDVKLYKWTEDWNYASDKSSFIAYSPLNAASGTITYTTAQMESFGGEGTYVAVIGGTGWTKFAEIVFTYVPNPKGMTIATTTVYRGQYINIDLYGAEEGDAVAIFAKGVPNYTTLGGSYRGLTDGQTATAVPTSELTPGEYTVGLWASGWDFNERINITIEKMDNDINYDAKVNIIDLVRLKKMSAELVDKTDDADLNSDGEVNGTDLTYLRMILLGKDPAEAVVIGDNEVVDNWDF